ncbi:hypothetical protein BpHYR1_046297 [Brachionus plicatilis]|uniref:Uncharacterized protein n=1 Tax=Brachionus plicatilis TaxID=10195 RepID=A0A3M7P1B0_BRAPC|nr:hypothetical protein BpHYR1_046297 [Brachionus plicatilis]
MYNYFSQIFWNKHYLVKINEKQIKEHCGIDENKAISILSMCEISYNHIRGFQSLYHRWIQPVLSLGLILRLQAFKLQPNNTNKICFKHYDLCVFNISVNNLRLYEIMIRSKWLFKIIDKIILFDLLLFDRNLNH